MGDLGQFYDFIEENRNSDAIRRKRKIKERIERERRGNIEPDIKESSFDAFCNALNEEFNKPKISKSSPQKRVQTQVSPKSIKEEKNKKVNQQKTLLEQSLQLLHKESPNHPQDGLIDLFVSNQNPGSLIDRTIEILSTPQEPSLVEEDNQSIVDKSVERFRESLKYEPKQDYVIEEVSEIEKLKKEVDNLKTLLYNTMKEVNVQGGGGEVRLEFLDDVDRTSATVDRSILMYDETRGGWIGTEGANVGCATCLIGNPNVDVGYIHASDLVRIGDVRSDDSILGFDNTNYSSDSTGEGIRLDPNGSAILTGIVTASGFVGDGSGLDGVVSIAGTTNTLLSIDPGSLVDNAEYKLVYSSSIGGFIVTSV